MRAIARLPRACPVRVAELAVKWEGLVSWWDVFGGSGSLRGASLRPRRLGSESVEEAEEDRQFGAPSEEAIDERPACAQDLCRDEHEAVDERAEVHA